jgi:hypothetical protein
MVAGAEDELFMYTYQKLVPDGQELFRFTSVDRELLSAPPPVSWSPFGHVYPAPFCVSAGLATAFDCCCRYPAGFVTHTA